MNSNFPNFKWRPIRGKTREKKNQLSIHDLDQMDKRDELLDLIEEDYEYNKPYKKFKKTDR